MDLYNFKIESKTKDETLITLGLMKEEGEINCTWDDICEFINSAYGLTADSSTYRRKFRKYQETTKDYKEQEVEIKEDPDFQKTIKEFFKRVEHERVRLNDERNAYDRKVKYAARDEAIFDLFREEIRRFNPDYKSITRRDNGKQKSIYVMLSDIHYGICFDNPLGKYNPELAKSRVLEYADEIIRTQEKEKAQHCFISLMGDMVSGAIHQTIRIENKENIISQVINVSELVAEFIYRISQHFSMVFVNNVSGNHSRLDKDYGDQLRNERLDELVPWYCKTKLEKCQNVYFSENQYDSTFGDFLIYGKHYICVHGDLDNDLIRNAQRIESYIGQPVYCILAGHMHVSESRMDSIITIRNGCVCGSGDDYTMRKRLFGKPTQTFFIIDETGITSIHPVVLS